MDEEVKLPSPEFQATGEVMYRCAECGELMKPENAVIIDGRAYHPSAEMVRLTLEGTGHGTGPQADQRGGERSR